MHDVSSLQKSLLVLVLCHTMAVPTVVRQELLAGCHIYVHLHVRVCMPGDHSPVTGACLQARFPLLAREAASNAANDSATQAGGPDRFLLQANTTGEQANLH